MAYDYLIARNIDGQDFVQVVAYGFVTEEGAEDELQAIAERMDADEDDYILEQYHSDKEVKLYYDGENFSRTLSGAEARA